MRTDILVLVLMLVGGIQVLNFKCDSCGLLWMCFTRLRKFLSTLILLSIFIMKGIRFYQSLYLHLLGWSNGFALTLQLWYIMLVDFHNLHQPGIPRVSPAWSWYIILFTCCWIQFGGILLRIFASIFIRAFHLVCLVYPPPPLSYEIFVWFWNQGSTGPHWMVWEVLHSILLYGSVCKGFI